MFSILTIYRAKISYLNCEAHLIQQLTSVGIDHNQSKPSHKKWGKIRIRIKEKVHRPHQSQQQMESGTKIKVFSIYDENMN